MTPRAPRSPRARGRKDVDAWPLLATADREDIADWAEVRLLLNEDENVSKAELRTGLRIGGSADAVQPYDAQQDDPQPVGDKTDELLTDVFTELADRQACVGPHRYPFDLDQAALTRKKDKMGHVYRFLLLLSHIDPVKALNGHAGSALFQRLCAYVAKRFLVGFGRVPSAKDFGFPRPEGNGFADALDDLCIQFGEGRKCNRDRATVCDQKDACLDVAAWSDFPDRRSGRLALFGQCASGADWRKKTKDLHDTASWCRFWMTESPLLLPIRAFFVPVRVSSRLWDQTVNEAGLLFDRCRITRLTGGLGNDLLSDIQAWSALALEIARKRMADY